MLAGQTAPKRSPKKAASSKRKPAVVRRVAQQQPTVERYKEIQQALADKGYFRGPVDGAWGADSVEALKRFQREQSLENDGKIGSLSLIALGLGPQRGAASASPAPGSSQPVP
jgi:peptidoglycan hydrolase-like protein with peptidoglycan-binding domain